MPVEDAIEERCGAMLHRSDMLKGKFLFVQDRGRVSMNSQEMSRAKRGD